MDLRAQSVKGRGGEKGIGDASQGRQGEAGPRAWQETRRRRSGLRGEAQGRQDEGGKGAPPQCFTCWRTGTGIELWRAVTFYG